MDFTSDLLPKGGSDGGVHSDQLTSDSIPHALSSQDVNTEELEIARLQEEKDLLLTRRERLLSQLATQQKELQRLRTSSIQESDRVKVSKQKARSSSICIPRDSAALVELFVKSLPDVAKQNGSNIDPLPFQGPGEGSALADELANKYDALPVMNSQLRFDTLKRSCPFMVVKKLNDPHTILSYESDNGETFFTLQYDLQVAKLQGQVLSLKNIKLSEDVATLLHPLVDYCGKTMNIGFLLFGCNETARLLVSRRKVIEKVKTAIVNSIPSIKVVEEDTSIIKLSKLSWDIELYYDLHFQEDKIPLPASRICVKVYKNKLRLAGIQEISNALIKEYGIVGGIVQLIKALYT